MTTERERQKWKPYTQAEKREYHIRKSKERRHAARLAAENQCDQGIFDLTSTKEETVSGQEN